MMSIVKIVLILIVMFPAGFVMIRTATDIRKDIIRDKRKARAEISQSRGRLRVVKR